jgi:hypothetical protein
MQIPGSLLIKNKGLVSTMSDFANAARKHGELFLVELNKLAALTDQELTAVETS